MAGSDKKLYKMLNQEGQSPNDLQALSPPQTGQASSISPKRSMCYGSYENQSEMADACSRKMLFYLISTLNASFQPDYDFSNAKSEEFSREPNLQNVINAIDNGLGGVLGEAYSQFKMQLWAAIEEEIKLTDCIVYRYWSLSFIKYAFPCYCWPLSLSLASSKLSFTSGLLSFILYLQVTSILNIQTLYTKQFFLVTTQT